MKHRKKIAGVIAAVMLVTLLAAAPVMAQMPCIFTGAVTIDGEPYAAGGVVTIELADGTPVPTVAPVIVTATSEYGAVIPQEDGVPAEGDVLNFYVDGLFAGSSTWQMSAVKKLDLAVATDVTPPTVVTLTPVDVTDTSGRIRGNLTDLGTAATADVYFEYGPTADLGSATGKLAKDTPGLFTWNWTGLTPNTTYYYRAAADGDGTAYGEILSFTTLEEGVEPPPDVEHPPVGTFARELYDKFIAPFRNG